MKFEITRDWSKSFFVMIIAVIVMGMCVSLLVMCDMGTDTCSAMNYGISHKLGRSFGNYQLLKYNFTHALECLVNSPCLLKLDNLALSGAHHRFY